MQPHHVGYLVRDMETAVAEFERLGYSVVSAPTYDGYRDIDICFLENHGLRVELVMPASERSVVYGLLKKRGPGPYHICYEVDDLPSEAELLRQRGYVPMGESLPAPALRDVPAAFFFHLEMGIVELIARA